MSGVATVFILAASYSLTNNIAFAQEPPAASEDLQPRIENGRQIYDAAQFARFTPRTALDMARQIPGFTIDTGDSSARGFGQADENVLINGARISGKNSDAITFLSRISAVNVVRLEIVDGATLSISGLSGQVLNLVTNNDTTTGITGNFNWAPRWGRAGDDWFNGDASISGRIGKGDFTLAIQNTEIHRGNSGLEQVTDRQGGLLFERDEVARYRQYRPKISGTFNRTSAGGSVFNANGAFEFSRTRETVYTDRFQTGAPNIFELYDSDENAWNSELGVDYEFALGGGRLKLIGLQRLEHTPIDNFFGQTFSDGLTAATGARYQPVTDEGESILRAEYGWKTAGGTDWGVSIEGAYNYLDNAAEFAELDEAGIFQPVILSNVDSKVTEYRGEMITTYGRQIAPKLTVQATLGGEYSQISQSGPLGDTRSFVRPKGSVSLAWQYDANLDLNLRFERLVGQLDFFDFVESLDVSQDVGDAGNPQLVPPQSWRAELEANQKLGAWGLTTIKIYGEKFSDTVDSIPITETTEARGNLNSATSYGVQLTSSILFDPIGWKGAKLDIDTEVRKSRLRDPLTAIHRRINEDKIYSYDINLRHDIPNSSLAWGLGVSASNYYDSVRLDQFRRFRSETPYLSVFAEHKDVLGMTVNATLGNLLDSSERLTRTVYQQRRDGPVAFVEDRLRYAGLNFRLTVSGNF